MEQPKLDRQLRLMMMLTGNCNLSIAQIAERFDTTERTIYRYIDTFRAAGFVIKRVNGFYRIDKSSPYFREISSLVHFTKEEAYILKSAIESIDETNLIKQNLKRKLYTVYDYKILAETVVKGKNSININRLSEAIDEHKQVILKAYSSANSNKVSDRLVEPFRFTTNYIQLWAFEPHSGRNKLYKISRIHSVELLPDEWQNSDKHTEGRIDIFRISSQEQLPVKLKLGLRAASLLTEEYPLAEKYLSPCSDNCWLLETEVCSYEGIGRFAAGLMDDIEWMEPAELREFMEQKISRSLLKLKNFQHLVKKE
ncbi:MAG: WYL domain-containing protein [Lentimicrobiaceae bacterium]|nr:WYL domain-containing protein [Lentimicrobiaceae bacterium]